MNEPPVLQRYPGKYERTRAAATPYGQHLRDVQAGMRAQIENMQIRVTGSVQHVMNGLFVNATPAQAEALRQLPGVKAVLPLRQYRKEDQLTLSNVQGAWNASKIGGQGNAGAGLKIAIIDTGIDATHPSFQDSTLKAPAGYPICPVQTDCALTNGKVIVARSYVSDIVFADVTNTSDPAAQSRPDDISARDLDGHGTAVASVAAGLPAAVNGTNLSGVAPKAYLGNYKVFGSNDVNPNGSGNILQAVDDAITDGMDVINLSLGGPSYGGPLDTGASCGLGPGQPCDALAYAIEQAVQNGEIVVVAAAGNEGANGYQFNLGCGSPPCFDTPTFSTVGSPGYAPSAIAVGGVENDVTYVQSIEISASSAPANLRKIQATQSLDGPAPPSPLTAPLVDVTQVGNADGLLCSPISPAALTGLIALVQRGSCDSADDGQKVMNAQNAGALGVILVDDGRGLGTLLVGSTTSIPAFLVSQSDGTNLKSYIDSHARTPVTMDPSPIQVNASALGYLGKSVAYFASRGPVPATGALKPDISAAATDFLLAVQRYDPYGELFSLSRYAAADGTSFATPLVAGAAALVKQANPKLTPLQIKSALVNTGSLSGLTNATGSGAAQIVELGTGLTQAQNAVISTVQVVPSSVSFGILSGSLPSAQALTVSNTGTGSVNLQFTVTQPAGLKGTQVNLSASSLPVAAGQSGTITASLSGSVPAAGRYEGMITVTGAPVPMTIPYLFVVGNNIAYDIIPLNAVPPGSPAFDGPVGQEPPPDYGPIGIQVIDRYGVPVSGAPVSWSATQGGGRVVSGSQNTDTSTDSNGLAFATVVLGPNPGDQEFTATVNGMAMPFNGTARAVPTINNPNGIIDAASFTAGRAVAPGSWIAVFGANLSDTTNTAFSECAACSVLSQPLPMGIDGVSFSFDVPSANISLPGRILYVSPGQINVQVPWELAGQTSAIVKVMVNYTYSAEYTLQLATYSPGFFVNPQTHEVAALDLSYKVINTSNPAQRGKIVQLFVNGLGPVNSQPGDGEPGPPNTSATTTATPTVAIGGLNAPIQYTGLAPNFVGLYQVNVTVPEGAPSGIQPITISIGGIQAAQAFITLK
ncbi:MAG: S8 family serine peptidase [Bryobacteraceae bacterium]